MSQARCSGGTGVCWGQMTGVTSVALTSSCPPWLLSHRLQASFLSLSLQLLLCFCRFLLPLCFTAPPGFSLSPLKPLCPCPKAPGGGAGTHKGDARPRWLCGTLVPSRTFKGRLSFTDVRRTNTLLLTDSLGGLPWRQKLRTKLVLMRLNRTVTSSTVQPEPPGRTVT